MPDWTVSDLQDDGCRVTFTATFPDGITTDFVVDVPAGNAIVTDETGRRRTTSGRWLLPEHEVDGEWQPRPEDPTDRWVRVRQPRDVDAAVEAAVSAHAARIEGQG